MYLTWQVLVDSFCLSVTGAARTAAIQVADHYSVPVLGYADAVGRNACNGPRWNLTTISGRGTTKIENGHKLPCNTVRCEFHNALV